MRLDKYLQQKFNLKSRTYAENLVKTGKVIVNGKIASKSSYDVGVLDSVEIAEDENYASQGAYKLERAFEVFGIDVQDKFCADIGCSNGGFTDCLLRHGARKVLAVDVAECALPDSLLQSGKVEFLRANARELGDCPFRVDFVCSDLSFISLRLVLSSINSIMNERALAVVLVKPQFELDRSALNKNGIVIDEKLRKRAVENVKSYAVEGGFDVLGETQSPIRYANKNVEYLLLLQKRSAL